jgi:hypothetical protein
MLVNDKDRGPSLAKLMMGWAIGSVIGQPAHPCWWHGVRLARRHCRESVWRAVPWRCWCGVPFPANVKVPALNWQRWIQVIRSAGADVAHGDDGTPTRWGTLLVFSYIAPIMKTLHGVSGATLAGPLLRPRCRRADWESGERAADPAAGSAACRVRFGTADRDHIRVVAVAVDVDGRDIRAAAGVGAWVGRVPVLAADRGW